MAGWWSKKAISFSSRSLLFNKALDFALTKAGKDSNFKLKTEQKSIIEAVICLFVCLFLCVCVFFVLFCFVFFFHTICQDCNFPKEFPANFVARTCSISPLCLSFSSGFSFIPRFRKYWLHQVRRVATGNSQIHVTWLLWCFGIF